MLRTRCAEAAVHLLMFDSSCIGVFGSPLLDCLLAVLGADPFYLNVKLSERTLRATRQAQQRFGAGLYWFKHRKLG